MHKFLVIQTAFTGDVVLATAIVEKLHNFYPQAQIHFLVRKGNEGLLQGHPYIQQVLVWDKKQHKARNLLSLLQQVRSARYTHVINAHRFASSGLISFFSGAGFRSGFSKNPLSAGFTLRVPHVLSALGTAQPIHEINRNQLLIASLTDDQPALPKLYPSAADHDNVSQYQAAPYVCIAPSSVWFTKQYPAKHWAALAAAIPQHYPIFLLGAPSDKALGDSIIADSGNTNVINLCGKLTFLQSAALMQRAIMNYANDSAPLHFATAMDAPVTAVFCSTVPAFGFGPVRPNGRVVEVTEKLSCRPCGLHGHRACPQGHFKCANNIELQQLLWWI